MPFKTKSLAGLRQQKIKMSLKKLNKILDTNEEYKGFLFYSLKQKVKILFPPLFFKKNRGRRLHIFFKKNTTGAYIIFAQISPVSEYT